MFAGLVIKVSSIMFIKYSSLNVSKNLSKSFDQLLTPVSIPRLTNSQLSLNLNLGSEYPINIILLSTLKYLSNVYIKPSTACIYLSHVGIIIFKSLNSILITIFTSFCYVKPIFPTFMTVVTYISGEWVKYTTNINIR